MTKYLLDVEDELWREFKRKLYKSDRINDVIVELIKQYVHGVDKDEGEIEEVKSTTTGSDVFNIPRGVKQIVLSKTNRYDESGNIHSVIAVVGDALSVPEIKEYVQRIFTYDEKFEDWVRTYSEAAYNKIVKDLKKLTKGKKDIKLVLL